MTKATWRQGAPGQPASAQAVDDVRQIAANDAAMTRLGAMKK
jgi:hypothetical protein